MVNHRVDILGLSPYHNNMSLTTDASDPRLGRGVDTEPVPQNEVYLILSEEERAKGFVRPVRYSYKHVGSTPKYPLRDLTEEEHKQYDRFGYVKYEEYPKSEESSVIGCFWTQKDLDKKACFTVTTMGRELSETWATKVSFYGATYCYSCQKHLPVREFIWIESDGSEGPTVGS